MSKRKHTRTKQTSELLYYHSFNSNLSVFRAMLVFIEFGMLNAIRRIISNFHSPRRVRMTAIPHHGITLARMKQDDNNKIYKYNYAIYLQLDEQAKATTHTYLRFHIHIAVTTATVAA